MWPIATASHAFLNKSASTKVKIIVSVNELVNIICQVSDSTDFIHV